ncbi:MAG: hypothetical protein ABW328_05690 [Ilumatobacteraceae bacterium]
MIIGIDPHKASHTAVAVGDGELELARLQVRSGHNLRQRHSEGRAYCDRRIAEGTTGKEAVRALKRQLPNIVYRHLVADAIH